MSLLDSIKPFWPLLFTIILPRALGYLNALKTAYRTRPPPTPLPSKVDRSLNILFCSIVFFFIQSFSRGVNRDLDNIFSTTNSRLGIPTDVLFTRLGSLRPNGILSSSEDTLRSLLTNKDARLIYLTHGPEPLLDCSFCHPSRPHTYTLYTIPRTVLLPHLLHIIMLGLATSGGITSPLSAKSRIHILLPALGLLTADLYLNTFYSPYPSLISPTRQAPTSLYTLLRLLRPLSICLLDAGFAFYLWATCTNRFIFFPFLSNPNAQTSVDTLQAQSQDLVRNSSVALQTAQAKLRALNVARNTIVRDESLKRRDYEYWDSIRRYEQIEGVGQIDESVWEEEEVQAAIARMYGQGGLNIPRARQEAGAFVEGVTRDLESNS